MAKVKKSGKKKVKKNIPIGEVHIQSSFNNTIITHSRPAGQCGFLVERRCGRFQGLPEEHTFCRSARCGERSEEGYGTTA